MAEWGYNNVNHLLSSTPFSHRIFSCTFPLFLSFSILPSVEDVLYHEGKVRSHCFYLCGARGWGWDAFGMGFACVCVCVCVCPSVELACHCSVCFTPLSLSSVSFLWSCLSALSTFFFSHSLLVSRVKNISHATVEAFFLHRWCLLSFSPECVTLHLCHSLNNQQPKYAVIGKITSLFKGDTN